MDLEFERPRDSRDLEKWKSELQKEREVERRSKTPLSTIYQQQVENIKMRHGDLEEMRLSLGLSRRQLAQLLMVDPSAWTRWTKSKTGAPPHVYRSLDWLMELEKKGVGNDSLTTVQELRVRSEIAKEGLKIRDLGHTVRQLKKGDTEKIRRLKVLVYFLAASQAITWILVLLRMR